MKKPLIIITILMVAAVLIRAGNFAWHNLRGARPAVLGSPQDIAKVFKKDQSSTAEPAVNPASIPLKLPPGFTLSVFAAHVPGARVLALDPEGTLLVSLTRQGKVVALPDKNQRRQGRCTWSPCSRA